VAIGTIGGDLVLMRNTGAGGTWLTVRTPSPAPGAVVTVELAGGRALERELHAGSSYLSSDDPRAHFGLDGATQVGTVTVRWPDGTTTTLPPGTEANQIVEIEPEPAR
jgi:hypothetical protein